MKAWSSCGFPRHPDLQAAALAPSILPYNRQRFIPQAKNLTGVLIQKLPGRRQPSTSAMRPIKQWNANRVFEFPNRNAYCGLRPENSLGGL
jgi:hypothetical protein